MPMFTSNEKIAAVATDKGLVQLGVAISFEAAYNLMNDEYEMQGTREEYLAWVADENEQEDNAVDEDCDDWTDGYDEYRTEMYDAYHDSVICEGEDNTLECPM